jgi:ketosteroid isomerase-like protein
MIKTLLLCTSFFLAQFLCAQNKDTQSIRALLAKQEAAWNQGNLEQFMVGYWESDSLVFIGKIGPKYGYANTLANYKKSYPDTSYMGKLHFDILSMQALNAGHYFVIGKWKLTRTVGNVSGHFTLLFRKTKQGWKVIADHSS